MEIINKNAECRNDYIECRNNNAECRNDGTGYQIDRIPGESEITKAETSSYKLKQALPYAVLPFICAALFLARVGKPDALILLRFELLLITGYIAAVLDLKTRRIPNGLILLMLSAWTIIMTPYLFINTDAAVSAFIDSAAGFAIGGGLFLLVYIISRKGLGGGDVKFMAAAGAFLGFSGTIPALLFGSVFAALTGLTLIMLKKIGRKDTIPLAPFLYIGILITIFLQ